jgi:dolichol-phosphate mannosyltransferase
MIPRDASFSVVVPFHNEGENVRFVLEELRATLPLAEIIAVDDGSNDRTWTEINQMSGVRGLRFVKTLGQSAAIYHGLHACTGDLCGLMDGDGQNDPANFHRLLEDFHRGAADVVCGYRADRHDSWNRKVASRLANGIRRAILNDGVRDTGCSQKVFRREAVELLIPFRGMHRYLPALFKHAGLRITEVPVQHRSRRAGTSKYNNWSRAVAGAYDLIGVAWLLSRRLPRAQIQTSE